MSLNLKIWLLVSTIASGTLCCAGIIQLLVSLWFFYLLHPMHVVLQITAGIGALVTGVLGIIYSRRFTRPSLSAKTFGIRVSLFFNFTFEAVALAILLLDRAGFAQFLKNLLPEHVPHPWMHAAPYLPKGILALSSADSISLFMGMLIWICTLPCIILHERDLGNVTMTSVRWVWKGNETTFRSPGTVMSFGIPPKKSRWRTVERNAVFETCPDVPDCRPKRKCSFRSYTAQNFQNKTGRTPSCRMSSFRPLIDNSLNKGTNSSQSSFANANSPNASASSSLSRRTPKKIATPTTPRGYVPYTDTPPERSKSLDSIVQRERKAPCMYGINPGTPDYVPWVPPNGQYKRNCDSFGPNAGTPDYVPYVHVPQRTNLTVMGC